jgi:hypothetical protein
MLVDTAKLFFERVWVHFGIPYTITSYRDNRFLNTFWSSCWSLLDTNLTKSTTFHPQTDVQIEVVNQMIVHILHIYNSKNLHIWDEILPYVKKNYNKAFHSSTDHIPFQVGLRFQPLGPIDVALPLATTHEESFHVLSEVDKATRFIEGIQHILQQVHEIFRKPMLSIGSAMINTGYRNNFRWETRSGYICRKRSLQGPIISSTHFAMGLTLSPRLWVEMILRSTLHPSLAYIQCSMRTSFDHIFHHYRIPQRSKNSWQQHSSTLTSWNMHPLII